MTIQAQTVTALTSWEEALLSDLYDLMEDTIPGDVIKSNLLSKRMTEVFSVVFDLADREKPVNQGTDGRKKDRPSRMSAQTLVATVKAKGKQWYERRALLLKTALTAWQQKFMEGLIDLLEEHVPGGLAGILDKRTKYRVNRVMDMVALKAKPGGRGNIAADTKTADGGSKTEKEGTGLSGWQQTLLEGLMDLVDEHVPGGQMNAKRSFKKLNDVFDLLWKMRSKKKKAVADQPAHIGGFEFSPILPRHAFSIVALVEWQQTFLEEVIVLLEDTVPGGANDGWKNKQDAIEDVIEVAFRMIKEGDLYVKPHQQAPGMKATRPNQHGPGKFKKQSNKTAAPTDDWYWCTAADERDDFAFLYHDGGTEANCFWWFEDEDGNLTKKRAPSVTQLQPRWKKLTDEGTRFVRSKLKNHPAKSYKDLPSFFYPTKRTVQ